ncbi:hypothetical protein OPT61_g5759 [Boeremia exigua]|uniref:Uncharacterized protein n=1 Tax=Boeremia exigua TaxID=749465 RepID=A0ACC2I940_9PLEO|nr:hypothetical protein OPT61_g5759 [Boeremia exigua]
MPTMTKKPPDPPGWYNPPKHLFTLDQLLEFFERCGMGRTFTQCLRCGTPQDEEHRNGWLSECEGRCMLCQQKGHIGRPCSRMSFSYSDFFNEAFFMNHTGVNCAPWEDEFEDKIKSAKGQARSVTTARVKSLENAVINAASTEILREISAGSAQETAAAQGARIAEKIGRGVTIEETTTVDDDTAQGATIEETTTVDDDIAQEATVDTRTRNEAFRDHAHRSLSDLATIVERQHKTGECPQRNAADKARAVLKSKKKEEVDKMDVDNKKSTPDVTPQARIEELQSQLEASQQEVIEQRKQNIELLRRMADLQKRAAEAAQRQADGPIDNRDDLVDCKEEELPCPVKQEDGPVFEDEPLFKTP